MLELAFRLICQVIGHESHFVTVCHSFGFVQGLSVSADKIWSRKSYRGGSFHGGLSCTMGTFSRNACLDAAAESDRFFLLPLPATQHPCARHIV